MSSKQPIVLIIGATGQTGRLIVEDLKRDPATYDCVSPPTKRPMLRS